MCFCLDGFGGFGVWIRRCFIFSVFFEEEVVVVEGSIREVMRFG